MRAVLGIVALVFASTLSAQEAAQPATEDIFAVYQEGLADLKGGRAEQAIGKLEKVAAVMAKSPMVLLTLSRAQARAGHTDDALRSLERATALGFGVGAGEDPAYDSLRALPRFQALLPRIAENAKTVSRSTKAFTIAEPDLIPEGIAWDPKSETLYVGSLHKRKIVAIGPDGRTHDFVRSGQDHLEEVLGMKVDAARRALWACSAEADASGGNLARHSALFRFDLATGRLQEQYPSPEGGRHLFNDLVVSPGGDVYLTDSEEGSVYRWNAAIDTLERFTPPGRLLYPNGIALSPDGKLLYVAQDPGIVVCELATGRSFELSAPPDVTLVGIDGLYFHRGSLIAVQNGVEPVRVAQFPLSPGLDRVTGCRVLERGNPLFEDPTTGAVAGGAFFYMANTQLSALQPGGVIKNPEKRRPVVILKMDLPE